MNCLVAIRADGNSEIGFGHLIRTQTLACQLEKCGAKVVFISKDPLNINNYAVLPLTEDQGPEDETVEKLLKESPFNMLVVDSYDYDQERLRRIEAHNLLTVYLDDLNRHSFDTDYVVNGNLYAETMDYSGTANFLLGPRYLLLREEFSGIAPRVLKPEVNDVLIMMGAADMRNITPAIIRQLYRYDGFSRLRWHVVIGPAFTNQLEIEAAAANHHNVLLHYSPDIKDLMSLCDISISAAGSTTYELAVSGVPSILVVVADNQIELAAEAARQGISIDLGWYTKALDSKLTDALKTMINDHFRREKMVLKGQQTIDGHGAKRVAAILMEAIRRKQYGH